jgi:hypothetical protein
VKARRSGLSLAVVQDLRVARPPATAGEVAAFETDVLAGFVLARAAAGLSDGTIASDVMHLEQVRNLWSWSRRVVVDSSIRRVWAGRRRPVTTWSQLVVS